jgi:uncharacterized protein YoxC
MTTGELLLIIAAVLCVIGFAALVVVLVRVLDALATMRREVDALRSETQPLLEDLKTSTGEARVVMQEARADLDRFDHVLGSAEAISDAVSGSGRVVRTAFSAPLIKMAGLATGTTRAVRRLRHVEPGQVELLQSTSAKAVTARSARVGRRRAGQRRRR